LLSRRLGDTDAFVIPSKIISAKVSGECLAERLPEIRRHTVRRADSWASRTLKFGSIIAPFFITLRITLDIRGAGLFGYWFAAATQTLTATATDQKLQ